MYRVLDVSKISTQTVTYTQFQSGFDTRYLTQLDGTIPISMVVLILV